MEWASIAQSVTRCSFAAFASAFTFFNNLWERSGNRIGTAGHRQEYVENE